MAKRGTVPRGAFAEARPMAPGEPPPPTGGPPMRASHPSPLCPSFSSAPCAFHEPAQDCRPGMVKNFLSGPRGEPMRRVRRVFYAPLALRTRSPIYRKRARVVCVRRRARKTGSADRLGRFTAPPSTRFFPRLTRKKCASGGRFGSVFRAPRGVSHRQKPV